MNEQILKQLKDKIRSVETDLTTWNIELKKRMEAAAEAEKMVVVLGEQWSLLTSQHSRITNNERG